MQEFDLQRGLLELELLAALLLLLALRRRLRSAGARRSEPAVKVKVQEHCTAVECMRKAPGGAVSGASRRKQGEGLVGFRRLIRLFAREPLDLKGRKVRTAEPRGMRQATRGEKADASRSFASSFSSACLDSSRNSLSLPSFSSST